MMTNTKFIVPNPGSGIISQGGGTGHLRNNKSISIGNPGAIASTNIEHSSLASTHRKKSSQSHSRNNSTKVPNGDKEFFSQ